MTPTDAYAELVRRSKEVGVINSCASVLGWDQQTYMPPKGAGFAPYCTPLATQNGNAMINLANGRKATLSLKDGKLR